MTKKKVKRIRKTFAVLTALAFVGILGSIGGIECGAVSIGWGVVQSVLSVGVFGFLARCCMAIFWGV